MGLIGSSPWTTWPSAAACCWPRHPHAVDTVVAGIAPDHLATLIYTSGTTGRPKGVELTQDNWTYEGAAVDRLGILRPDDLQYLWLPLSHSFGKVLLAAQLQIGFATAVDGRIDKIVENLAAVRPTFMAGAPRIFEKVHDRVVGHRSRPRAGSRRSCSTGRSGPAGSGRRPSSRAAGRDWR